MHNIPLDGNPPLLPLLSFLCRIVCRLPLLPWLGVANHMSPFLEAWSLSPPFGPPLPPFRARVEDMQLCMWQARIKHQAPCHKNG